MGSEYYDVIVIGGGAAGLMAAGTAAAGGRQVLLLEKKQRLGRKILITGKGRCNLTNNCDQDTLMRHIPENNKFLFSAFRQFSPADTMAFFENLGLPLKTERGSRVFPVSDKAADVAEAMTLFCARSGVIVKQHEVSEIHSEEGRFLGVSCADGTSFSAESGIVATGGLSYPATGSTGDGYRFARLIGHTVIPPSPSLVPLVMREDWCRQLQGLSLRNVVLTVFDTQTGKAVFEELGELLFTHFGLSGPLVLSASAHMRQMSPGRYTVSIDLKPALEEKTLDSRLLRDFETYNNRDLANGLGELLPRMLIPVVIRLAEIPPDKKIHQITKEERLRLLYLLKHLKMTVQKFRPVEEAIITRGGVKVTEIDPKTMESKCCKGLYFAGEVLDVDGYTGGFNLQIAFSTGYLAGKNA